MRWTDTIDIVIELSEAHADINPNFIRFTKLYSLVVALPEFSDDPEHSNEHILEAIQAAWIEEYNEENA